MIGGLVMYGVLGVAALGAIYAVDLSRQKVGAEKQRIADEKIYNACVKDRDTAVTANAQLSSDVERIRLQVAEQNKAVEKMLEMGKGMRQARVKAEIRAQEKIMEWEKDNVDLLIALRDKGNAGTCEQRMAKIDASLRQLAKQRVRDHPPGGEVQSDTVTIRAPK